MTAQEIGKWAFLIGVLISLVAVFLINVLTPATLVLILFVLGLIVGFLNVSRKNSVTFLMGVLVLLILGVGGISAISQLRLDWFYNYLITALGSFIAFVGAAGLIVAIKSILDTTEGLGIIRSRKKPKKKKRR